MNQEKNQQPQQHGNNLPYTITLDNFSSTTKLTNHEILPGAIGGSEKSIDQKNQPFWTSRNLEHPNSTLGSLIHIIKSSLGTGILAMPNAFKNGGLVVGFAGTVIVGLICTYCVHMLVQVSHEVCDRIKKPYLGFSETSEAAFANGPKQVRKFSKAARITVDSALILTYFMATCVYIVFIAESIEQLMEHWLPDHGFKKYHYMLIIMAGLLLTSQVRELKYLVPYSFLANVFMVISFAITLYYIFVDIPNPSDRDLVPSDLTTLPIFFSTVIFAMEGIGVVMPVENSMARPQYFLGCPGVLNTAMSFVIVLYSTIGFFGYLKYGIETKASITLNLEVTEIPAQVVKLLIALSVFFTYNLQMFVAVDIIWRKAIEPFADNALKVNVYQVLLRSLFVVGTTGVAIAVPDLEPIIGLVGAVCFSTLGLLIPSVIDSIWRWDDLGLFKFKLIKNILIGILALVALVAGTNQSIESLIKSGTS